MAKMSTEFIKRNLELYLPNVQINESLFDEWQSTEHYKNILIANLEYTFEMVCNATNNSYQQIMNGINLPFRNLNFQFTIVVLNHPFEGRYTSYCPELTGCISEGDTKMNSLKNLCFAIADTLVLNYDYLNIDPITRNPQYIDIKYGFTTIKDDFNTYEYAQVLLAESSFNRCYLSENHLLLKNDTFPETTLTLPHSGFKQITLEFYNIIRDIIL